MKNCNTVFYLFHITLPIIFGFLFYYLFCPDVYFVQVLDAYFWGGFHFPELVVDSFLVRMVRYFLLDFLWTYSLTFFIFYFVGNKAAHSLPLTFCLSFGLSAVLEILQCTSFVPGTFDMLDLFVEFLGSGIAVFIIKRLTFRRRNFLYER